MLLKVAVLVLIAWLVASLALYNLLGTLVHVLLLVGLMLLFHG